MDDAAQLSADGGDQEISAWIGRVTSVGLAGNIRRHYSPLVLYPLVGLLLIANVINLGADIGAMGSALQMVAGGPALLYARFWSDFGDSCYRLTLPAIC